MFLQRKHYTSDTVDVFVFLHAYAAFNFLYVVIPVAIVCLVVMMIILAIVSWLVYIKHHTTHKRNAQHVYDYVNFPPQPPPPRIPTHNNPAYVQVELTECVAYTSTHDPGSQNWLITTIALGKIGMTMKIVALCILILQWLCL